MLKCLHSCKAIRLFLSLIGLCAFCSFRRGQIVFSFTRVPCRRGNISLNRFPWNFQRRLNQINIRSRVLGTYTDIRLVSDILHHHILISRILSETNHSEVICVLMTTLFVRQVRKCTSLIQHGNVKSDCTKFLRGFERKLLPTVTWTKLHCFEIMGTPHSENFRKFEKKTTSQCIPKIFKHCIPY